MLCAVVDLSSSSYDVILLVDVVDELRDMTSLNVMRLAVTVPHDVTFPVQTGDVASTVVVDSTVEEGQPICQLCVPESKRVQVLKLVHDSVFGCHLRSVKSVRGTTCYLTGLQCARACTATLVHALRVDCGPDRRRPTPARQVRHCC